MSATTISHLSSLVPWPRLNARPLPLVVHWHKSARPSPSLSTTFSGLHTCAPMPRDMLHQQSRASFSSTNSAQGATLVDNHSSQPKPQMYVSTLCSQSCHTRFWKANRMRTMYVPGSETHVHSDYIIGHHHTFVEVNSGNSTLLYQDVQDIHRVINLTKSLT
jgi:hypothetical protein